MKGEKLEWTLNLLSLRVVKLIIKSALSMIAAHDVKRLKTDT